MKQFKTINQNKVDMEIGYKQEEPKIISDWLEQNRNPEIDKQVENELEYLSKQETLEEAIVDYSNDATQQLAFLNGAKWQQERSYSEEEVLEILFELSCNNDTDKEEMEEWFEQFKKK